MKKTGKLWLTGALLLLIYLFVLAGGVYALCYSAGGWKRDDMESYTRQRVIEYLNTGQINNWNNGGMAVIVYDEAGEFQDFFRSNGDPFVSEFARQSQSSLPQVLGGGTTMELYPFVRNYSKLGYTSYIYIGVPMVADGEQCGAFFWIKELTDLSETLIAYGITITVFFVTAAVLLIIYLRLRSRYEMMQNKYIDNITHEMKAPIASIRALTEALTDKTGKSDSERNIYYGMIIGEANRQEKMILDVLALAKLKNAPKKPDRQYITAAELFGPVCEKHASICELVGVEFHAPEELQKLPALSTDPNIIRQVLEIVLSNARKFVREDGRIDLTVTVRRRQIVVCVADNGVGIPEADLPYVFERFYKGSQRCNDTGSGLGLAIAKESLATLKERIWAESRENAGTSIYFTVARG